MRPGWHVYWRYPGDSGIATSVVLSAPAGFEVGPIRWPIPERFTQPGDIVAYGYEGEVVLAATVRAPAAAAARPVKIEASVDWLACAATCIPGHADLALEMPGAAAKPEVLREWRQRLPLEPSPATAEVRASGSLREGAGAMLRATVEWRDVPGEVELFLAPEAGLELSAPAVTTSGRTTEVEVAARPAKGLKLEANALEGVLVTRDAGGTRRGVAIAIPYHGKSRNE